MDAATFVGLLAVVVIYAGMHYYIYSTLKTSLGISKEAAFFLRIFLLTVALSFLGTQILTREPAPNYLKPIALVGSVWLGVMSLTLSLFIIFDVLKLLFPRLNSPTVLKPAITAIVGIIVLGSSYALYNSMTPAIKEITLQSEKIEPSCSGFTIVQLSDIHIHLLTSENWLNRLVDSVNAINPDLIVITGDLIDAHLCKINRFCSILGRLNSKNGVLAVAGNHEFYMGIDSFEQFARNSNITVLRNSAVTIGSLKIIGIDDKEAERFSGHIQKPAPNPDKNKFNLLLSHRPTNFRQSAESGIDLQLSGHTHAGQLPPLNFLMRFVYEYDYGLHRHNDSYIYTTSGANYWGTPMRLFSNPEIVKITLLEK